MIDKTHSSMQKEILVALSASPVNWLSQSDLLKALNRSPTLQNQASVSRALLRLCERGLVKRVRALGAPGGAFIYATCGDETGARNSTITTLADWRSPLQQEILSILDDFPFVEDKTVSSLQWAKSRDIVDRLKQPNTPSLRAAVSRSLLRMHESKVLLRAAIDGPKGRTFRYARFKQPRT